MKYLLSTAILSILLAIPLSLFSKPVALIPADLKQAYERTIHSIHSIKSVKESTQESHWAATNPASQLRLEFDGAGIKASSMTSDWQFQMQLTGVGGVTAIKPVSKAVTLVSDNKLTYQRKRLNEWYINDPQGLEQGFTINKPLEKREMVLQFSLGGNVSPRLVEGGQALKLVTAKGKSLSYKGLKAWDANGKVLPTKFKLSGANQLLLNVAVADAKYPVTIDPWLAEEQQVTPGTAVAISGNTAVIFGSNSGSNGSASDNLFFFTYDGSNWSLQDSVLAVPFMTSFAGGLSIDGNTVAIGTSTNGVGNVKVYTRSGNNTWSEEATLTPSPNTPGSGFGSALDIGSAGITTIIGAPNESKVYVFQKTYINAVANWSLQNTLMPSDGAAGDRFGQAVAMSATGDIIVGAISHNNFKGAAYIFNPTGASTWTEQQKLSLNTNSEFVFGSSVDISGDTATVGTEGNTHIFERATAMSPGALSTWSEVQSLTNMQNGKVDGDIVIASTTQSPPTGDRSIAVFTKNSAGWVERLKLAASDGQSGNGFPAKIDIFGKKVIAAAPGKNPQSAYLFNLGCDVTYTLPTNEWHQISLPCDPGSQNTLDDILSDDGLGANYGTDWGVWRYDTSTNQYVRIELTDTMVQGVGYWVIHITPGDKTLDMPESSLPIAVTQEPQHPNKCNPGTPLECFEIPLAPPAVNTAVQWNMIGSPFANNQALSESVISTESAGSSICSFECDLDTAQTDTIFNSTLFSYNNGINDYDTTGTASGTLNPWKGYWAAALANSSGTNLKLWIPQP